MQFFQIVFWCTVRMKYSDLYNCVRLIPEIWWDFFIHDFLKHYGFKRYVCIINFQANRTITLLYSVRCSSTQWTKTYIWKKCNSDLIMQFIINLQQAYNSNLNYLCWKFQYKLIIAIFFHFKHIVYTRIFLSYYHQQPLDFFLYLVDLVFTKFQCS